MMEDEQSADKASVREASARFYAAVNAVLRGDPAPMLALWSHADDATYCDPSGAVVIGWDALERYWQVAAERNVAASERLSATSEDDAVVVGGELAYTVTTETVRRVNGSVLLIARATNVYRCEEGRWRMRHRHADAAPKRLAEADHAG